MFNDDIEVSVCKPTQDYEALPQRRGRRGDLRPPGRGVCALIGHVPFREKDYVVIPRGTTHASSCRGAEQFWICFHTPGEIETPSRYRNRYGQLLEHAPFYSATSTRRRSSRRSTTASTAVTVRVRGGHQDLRARPPPFDVVGWDGYVWPYTFNADDFEPRAGRFHLPPPPPDLPGPELRHLHVRAADARLGPAGGAAPYHHSNIQSEEVMFYAEGGTRAQGRGHRLPHPAPSGLPHGPQPGAVERALGGGPRTSSR